MGTGKKKIEIKKIEKESSRMVTFSKRRKGLFKKAEQLQGKTDAKVSIVVFSPAGNPYTFGDVSLFDAALGNILNTTTTALSGAGCSASNGFEFEQGADPFGASTSYHNGAEGLKQWLDSIDVERCNDIGQLLQLKEQLRQGKEMTRSTPLSYGGALIQ